VLIEGLRAELPEVFALAKRIRRPIVPRMPAWAAALGGLGVRAMTFQLLTGALSLVWAFGLPSFRTFEATTVIAYSAGAFVAFESAGWRGFLAMAGLATVLWAEQPALSIPSTLEFCANSDVAELQRQGFRCDIPGQVVSGFWPIALGLALGALGRDRVRQGARGWSVLAIAFGVSALVYPIARLAIVPIVGLIPRGQSAGEVFPWIVGAQVVGALGLGVIVGFWGRRHILDGAVIGAFYLLPWVRQFVLWRQDAAFRGFVFDVDWQAFVPVGWTLSALLGLVGGRLLRAGLSGRRRG
jgi:hypothetical protein